MNSLYKVHQSRVSRCPEAFPAGFYWYGNGCAGPGRPLRWIEEFLWNSDGTTDDSNLQEPREPTNTSSMEEDGADTSLDETQDTELSTSRESAPEGPSEEHPPDVPEESRSDSSDLPEDEGASVTDDPVMVPVPADSTEHKSAISLEEVYQRPFSIIVNINRDTHQV